MLRLTVFVCAAVYAGLVIFSDSAPERDAASAPAAQDVANASESSAPQQVTLVTYDGRSLPVAAVIAPGRILDGSGEVKLVSTPRMAETVSISASQGQPERPVAEVTGNSVNLRAGPSTRDRVLTALVRGEQVELLGATGDGWAQIRSVSTGVEGFMAVRFLSPLN